MLLFNLFLIILATLQKETPFICIFFGKKRNFNKLQQKLRL